jgi:putative endonuclease
VVREDTNHGIGVTNDLDRRLEEHNEGINPKAFTFRRSPVILKYWLRFTDINQAIDWEIQLKGWGRKKHCSKKTGKNTQSSTSSD